jgi:hypothetical protein
MAITNEEVINIMNREVYATLVTKGKNGMSSRTMTFGYAPDDKIFILTHKGTPKLEDIAHSPEALFHISNIGEDVTQSTDVSVEGVFEPIEFTNPLFKVGMDILGNKNPQIIDMLADEYSRDYYAMLMLTIKHLTAWNYMQIINGEPKTVLL